MPRAEKKIHYIYKTTCVVTGRYYIGMHSTNNLEDGYLGSGKRLRRSVQKYGKDKHTKEILEYCNTRELLAERERFIVTIELCQDSLSMNLREGGTGGNVGYVFAKRGYDKMIVKMESNPDSYKKRGESLSRVMQKRIQDGTVKIITSHYDWTGKKHKPETIEKMKSVKQGHGVGEKNSQYGKPRSEETKRKISEALKRMYKTDETKSEQIRNRFIGKPRSEEIKRKISETMKGRNLEKRIR